MSRIVVAGASGLIGQPLVRALRAAGHRVTTLVRRTPASRSEVRWDPDAGKLPASALEGADAVINLSGASMGRIPWTRSYQRKMLSSRLDPTRLLAETMVAMEDPPATFLSASAVGFYGDRPRVRLDDDSPRGDGFIPELVLAWEQAAAIAATVTRVVTLRSGVVVAPGGGFGPIRILTGVGLGTQFGSGRQFWPWISFEDEIRAIMHLLTSRISGAVVLAGPTPATSDEVTATYAGVLRRPRLLWVPAWAIRLGLGEAGQRLLLDDMQVQPVRLAADGFEWRHRTVRDAITVAVGRR